MGKGDLKMKTKIVHHLQRGNLSSSCGVVGKSRARYDFDWQKVTCKACLTYKDKEEVTK